MYLDPENDMLDANLLFYSEMEGQHIYAAQ